LGTPELAHLPDGILIGSAVLQGTSVQPTCADRQTDHAICDICSNRPHLTQCVYAIRCGITIMTKMPFNSSPWNADKSHGVPELGHNRHHNRY